MIELRQQPRFAHKRTQPGHESRLICGRTRQQRAIVGARSQSSGHELLDGHGAVQRMVEGLVHHAKAPHPQQGQDFKLTQPEADRQGIDVQNALRGCRFGTFSHGEKPQESCAQKVRRRRYEKAPSSHPRSPQDTTKHTGKAKKPYCVCHFADCALAQDPSVILPGAAQPGGAWLP